MTVPALRSPPLQFPTRSRASTRARVAQIWRGIKPRTRLGSASTPPCQSSPRRRRGQVRPLRSKPSDDDLPLVTEQSRSKASGDKNGESVRPEDFGELWQSFKRIASPYWTDAKQQREARLRLAGVVALSLSTTGISVLFNLTGRDFYNALSAQDQAEFTRQLIKYGALFAGGIPFFVFRGYFQSRLTLKWREYLTEHFLEKYFRDRAYYQIQQQQSVDNPDQRMCDDVAIFTSTTLSFALTLLSSTVDLITFSGILYSIYPPLFAVLGVYAVGGSAASIAIVRAESCRGKPLVGLNFNQERREADFRFGMVRVRENAESIAFYKGEEIEIRVILARFGALLDNYSKLLIAERNLDFFTTYYKYIIQLLPVAVVAPIYFRGEVDFGVISQSSSAFSHILSDVSILVFDFQALAGFTAVLKRLNGFETELEKSAAFEADASAPRITSSYEDIAEASGQSVLDIRSLTLCSPGENPRELLKGVTVEVLPSEHLLIVGPSGAGKTSMLRYVESLDVPRELLDSIFSSTPYRAISGLWNRGEGEIVVRHPDDSTSNPFKCSLMFVPQRPYLVLGSLKEQLLYPLWYGASEDVSEDKDLGIRAIDRQRAGPAPSTEALQQVMRRVNLGYLLDRHALDHVTEWSSTLSLGEQQRIAFARILLSRPELTLLDEATR
eukprot:scaffold1741_cov409-Prasinococcus_capsulatus_cf.AAC.12